MDQSFTLAGMLSQTDAVGRAVFALLVIMSIASWYVTLSKALNELIARARSRRFLSAFNASAETAAQKADDPFSRMARQALRTRHANEALTRTLRRSLEEENARRESGLAVLASVGSTAPFVGLFGTVWGVYHALQSIGIHGQATLDRVAGPVGEALIMTAIGLAVAVPAVLAYNAFVRANRIAAARLDAFAHELFDSFSAGRA